MHRIYDGTKRPKPKENQPGNLHILLDIQQRTSGQGECTAGFRYLSMRIHPKRFQNFRQLYMVVQGRAQLEHSSHIVKVGTKATC